MNENRSCWGHSLRFGVVILIFATVMVIAEVPELWPLIGVTWLGLVIIWAITRARGRKSGQDPELEYLRTKYWDQARREGKHIDELQGFIPDHAWRDIRKGWKPSK